MFNEEDLTVASLARLVGSELNVIDKYTEKQNNGPANKLDPRTFLNKNNNNIRQNSNVIKHDGMAFYAGVDESMVQSMYPEPAATIEERPVITQSQSPPAAVISTITENFQTALAKNESLNLAGEKTLKSIDKTLKSIDKTQKLILELISNNINK